MYAHFFIVVLFLIFVAGMVWGALIFGALLRPHYPFKEKNAIYECGEPTIGSSWVRYNIRFYTTALLFLLFDVEVVLLIPVALWLKPAIDSAAAGGSTLLPWLILLEIGFFVFVLVVGLAYAWRNGGLDWVKGEAGEDRDVAEGEALGREAFAEESLAVAGRAG